MTVSRYDWQSILDFDVCYREIQAEHGFRWGTPAANLESLVLINRRQAQPTQYQVQHQTGSKPHRGGGTKQESDQNTGGMPPIPKAGRRM